MKSEVINSLNHTCPQIHFCSGFLPSRLKIDQVFTRNQTTDNSRVVVNELIGSLCRFYSDACIWSC